MKRIFSFVLPAFSGFLAFSTVTLRGGGKHEETVVRRKQIVDAARDLIVKYGSEHLTVRKIAKEIGVTEGALYRHFESKRDILSFLVDEIDDTILAELEVSPAGTHSSLETLESIITSYMAGVVSRRGMSFQVIAEIISLGDKRLNDKVYHAINKYIERIKEILGNGVGAGAIRQDIDLEAAGLLFFGMTQGLVSTWALSGYSFNLEEKYASLWRVFRNAITKNSGGTQDSL